MAGQRGLMRLAATGFAVTAAVVVTWALRRRFSVVTVSGDSMRPGLADGDRVLVRRAGLSKLQLGDIVVAERPPEAGSSTRTWMIKRVAALPGDRCPEPPATRVPSRLAELSGRPVPAGNLVVLGDNEELSYDSRVFGYLPASRVLGKVVRTRWRQASRSRL